MVSVIIPVYDGEQYIDTIVDCFEKQICKDFELVFVNDGSKDNSLEKLFTIKNSSPLTIKVITQANAGVSAARNAGLKNAEGQYICFCDVDDEVEDNYISEMLNTIEQHSVDLVICKARLIRLDGTSTNFPGETGTINIKGTIFCLKDFLYGRLITGCCTTMIRKTVIDSNNLCFEEGYKYSEDLHMMWKIIAFSKRIAYIDSYLYLYKQQTGSAMARFDEERLHGYKLMKGLEGFFEKHVPTFASEYKKFGTARIMWSITWQAAVRYDEREFNNFILKHNVKIEMKRLLTFKNFKVILSSLTFMISPLIFRFIAKTFGQRYIH